MSWGKFLSICCIALWLAACSSNATYDIDASGVPSLIANNFVALDKITQISKFRSSAGHDYSDSLEQCRSMKHYLLPKSAYQQNGVIKVYAPFNGTIQTIWDENYKSSGSLTNTQIHIVPDANPAFTFIFFHIDLLSSEIREGKQVSAGEQLGTGHVIHGTIAGDFDIALRVSTPSGDRLVSPFEAMTSGIFNEYVARGVSSTANLIISKSQRDQSLLTCTGEKFTGGTSSSSSDNWFTLN